MANPEPIRQEIRADYDGRPVEQASRDTRELAEATRQAGRQADAAGRSERTRAQRLAELRDRLTDLVRAEDRHERQLADGVRVTQRAEQASLRRRRQIDRIAAALREEERIQQRASAAVQGHSTMLAGLAGAARSVLPALGAGAGILGAYRLIRAELEHIIELQDRAFRSQVTLASAQRSLRLNLAGQPSSVIDEAFATASRIAQQRGIGEAQATLALAQAVSSTGGDLQRAAELTDLAAQIRPDQPGELGGISGALGDIGNAIGTTDPRESLGFFLTVAGLSRVAESERQFKNIPVAIKGLTGEGFSAADAGALFAAQTIGAGDVTGELSGTAVISFASQINEFFQELGRPERGSDALAALQRSPDLARRFVDVLSVERKAAAPLRELLLDPASSTARNFERFRGRFGDRSQLVTIAQSQLAELSRGEIEQTATIARQLDSAAESLLNLDTAGGRAGAVRSGIIEVLEAAGEGSLASRISELQFNVGGAVNERAVATAVAMLRRRRRELLNPAPPFRGGRLGGFVDQTPAVTATDVQQAATLDNLIQQLEAVGDVGASPVIQINQGTIIHQAGDPVRDDLAEGRPPN